jgi:pilus assembly protein Flp/PilA
MTPQPQPRPRDERGASAVEYALVAVLIAVVIIGSVTLLGTRTSSMFKTSCESVPDYTSGSTC